MQATLTTPIDAATSGETLLTDEDLAARWKCSASHVRALKRRRDGPPSVKLGALLRFRLSDVRAFEERQAGAAR